MKCYALIAFFCALLCSRPCNAQAVFADVAMEATAESIAKQPGFSISFDDELNKKLDDFERYLKHQKWEKAVTILSQLPKESSNIKGLLPGKDGFLIPAQKKFRELLLDIPAEGREAFNLFYDAKSKKIFNSISTFGIPSEQNLTACRNIVSNYFFTSVGDNAANLLGEAAFERGDFKAAAEHFSMILEYHPESEISELMLRIKQAVSLARSDQFSQAETVARIIQQQFSGQTVRIAGEDVSAEKYALGLIPNQNVEVTSSKNPNEVASKSYSAQPIQNLTTAWQSVFIDSQFSKKLTGNQNDYYSRGKSYGTFIPNFAFDAERVYANYFGICIAVDLKSGKLVWRSEKISELTKNFQSYQWARKSLPRYQVAVHNGTVLGNCLMKSEFNTYRALQRLYAFDAKTGKEKWNSKKVSTLSKISFLSETIFDKDKFYVLGHIQQQSNVILYCINLSNGKLLWSEQLGTVVSVNDRFTGEAKVPVPVFFKTGDTIRIVTNNGALIDFNAEKRKTNWIFKYAYAQKEKSRNYWNAPTPQETVFHSEGNLFEDKGVLYMKERGVRDLVALDSDKMKLIWRRPVKNSSVLVGMDEKLLYLLSDELNAINRKTHKLEWTIPLPITAGGLSAVVTPTEVHVFTGRGIFKINKTNGDIEGIHRGEDMSSLGGRLALIDGKVIAISNRAITAYKVETSTEKSSSQNRTQK